jgi:peptide/nickel transport system permease protein
MARLNIGGKRVTQEQIEKWKAERGYDKPLYWNDAEAQGTEQLTRTVLLGALGVAVGARLRPQPIRPAHGDIGHEVATRMGVSLQLALPLFVLQVIASTASRCCW